MPALRCNWNLLFFNVDINKKIMHSVNFALGDPNSDIIKFISRVGVQCHNASINSSDGIWTHSGLKHIQEIVENAHELYERAKFAVSRQSQLDYHPPPRPKSYFSGVAKPHGRVDVTREYDQTDPEFLHDYSQLPKTTADKVKKRLALISDSSNYESQGKSSQPEENIIQRNEEIMDYGDYGDSPTLSEHGAGFSANSPQQKYPHTRYPENLEIALPSYIKSNPANIPQTVKSPRRITGREIAEGASNRPIVIDEGEGRFHLVKRSKRSHSIAADRTATTSAPTTTTSTSTPATTSSL